MDLSNFRYVAGTYQHQSGHQPSIACLQKVGDEWQYYFVLVRRNYFESEAEAQQEAESDMESAFTVRKTEGSDQAFAEHLAAEGYVRVKTVKVSTES